MTTLPCHTSQTPSLPVKGTHVSDPAPQTQCTNILGGSESALRLLLSMLLPNQYAAACELAQ